MFVLHHIMSKLIPHEYEFSVLEYKSGFKFIPALVLCFQCTFLFSLIKYTPLKFNNTYEYPWWGYAIGGLFTLSSTLMVPLWMLYAVCITPGTLRQVNSKKKGEFEWSQNLKSLKTASDPSTGCILGSSL